MSNPQTTVTALLLSWSDGDEAARDRLMPLVFEELRRMAAGHFRRERHSHTLQPTALVNEVFLRLIDRKRVNWKNRAHFFGFAAQLMRRILVDHARAHNAEKRGGKALTVTLDESFAIPRQRDLDLIALDDALATLKELDERQSRIVELRFFAGLQVEEVAEVLGISPTTVKRDWRTARLWLYRELRKQ
ncbi:MAG: sigma-70 family RNA polymerase sigma factor [Acidobacteriota bacterium]